MTAEDAPADSARVAAERVDAARDAAARVEGVDAVRVEAARRRRLADVFGDVLPERATADRDDAAAAAGRDAELVRDVPPHHGT